MGEDSLHHGIGLAVNPQIVEQPFQPDGPSKVATIARQHAAGRRSPGFGGYTCNGYG